MADTQISLLSAASTLGGSEIVPGVQSAANVGITVSQINDFIAGSSNAFTGTNGFSLIPNVSWSALTNGATVAAAINTQYYVTAFTSNTTISSYTGTPANGTKVAYLLVGCNGTASLTFPAAQRSGDATGTSTSIVPTAGTHQVVFTYVNGAWYYSDDIVSNSVANGGTGVTSLTAYAPVFGGTTSTGAVQSGTTGTAGQVLVSNGSGALPTFQNSATRLGSHTTPDTTAGSITWTSLLYEVFTNTTTPYALPAAAGYDGRAVIFYVTGTNAITIDPNGSEVIVRAGTAQTGGVTMTLTGAAGNYVAMICDGVRWATLGYSGTLAAGA